MEGAEHDGLLGPDSVAWRVLDHPAALIGGLRALIVQSLHPLAMAGVAQHSDYKRRPLERLRRTAYYVGGTAMGDRATALAAVERVKKVHKRVRGIDPVTGREYNAEDPETQVWVHTVEWHSFLVAHQVFGERLTAAEQDRYMSEGVRIAALLDVPEAMVPASIAEVRDYFERVAPMLCVSGPAWPKRSSRSCAGAATSRSSTAPSRTANATTGPGRARRRRATSPRAVPRRASSAAGPEPAHRSRRTRSTACAPRSARTPRP